MLRPKLAAKSLRMLSSEKAKNAVLVAAFDSLRNVLVDDVRITVAIDAHKNVLIGVGKRLQVLVIRCNANFDLS
jgi:hypothetical protein